MSGRVAHGEKLGRELGFPTANIHIHRKVSPLQGIFAVEVYGLEEEPLQGVASIGIRPTVGGTKVILEVYLFDFNQDIYGRHLQVSFLHKIRDEEHFESLEILKEKIAEDVVKAKEFFKNS
jgi:riboflavin kinase/FMN adenylyltransferase